MESVKALENIKDFLEVTIKKELLLLGTDGPDRLSYIDSLFEKMREIDNTIDRIYNDKKMERKYVNLSGYDHLYKLSNKKEIKSFYAKLSNKPEFFVFVGDKDGRIYAIE